MVHQAWPIFVLVVQKKRSNSPRHVARGSARTAGDSAAGGWMVMVTFCPSEKALTGQL